MKEKRAIHRCAFGCARFRAMTWRIGTVAFFGAIVTVSWGAQGPVSNFVRHNMASRRVYASQTEDQAGRSLPAIPAELLEQFGNGPMTAEATNAATLALKKALIGRALGGEMNHNLGYPPGASKPATVSNQRDGIGAKTILTEDGPIRMRRRATVTAALPRCRSPSTSGASQASSTRSLPCTPV